MTQQLYINSKHEIDYFKFPLVFNYDNSKNKNDTTFPYESCYLTTSYGIKNEFNKNQLLFYFDYLNIK